MKKQEINEWITKAQGDLLAAEKILEQKILPWIIAFHCQQAVEKYLKALQIKKLNNYDKNHDLLKLAQTLKEKTLKRIYDDLIKLTDYYIAERYPGSKTTDISIEEAGQAVRTAQKIIAVLKKLL